MTADEVRAFAQRHIEHWKVLDAAAIAAGHAPDGVVENTSAGTHKGREAIRKNLQKWIDSFPDLRFTKEMIMADTDAAAIVRTVQGTQQGKFFGVPRRRPAHGVSHGVDSAVRERSNCARRAHLRLHQRAGPPRGDQDQPVVTSQPYSQQDRPAPSL